MKNFFLKSLSSLVVVATFSGCPMQSTPNANSQQTGLLQSVIGGKTEEDSANLGSDAARSFDAISSHVAMIALEEETPKNPGDPTGPKNRNVLARASAVILHENFLVTSAHTFEGIKLDKTHVGYVFFGASGPWQKRQKQEFLKSDILNVNSDDLAIQGWKLLPGHKDYVFIRLRNGIPPGFSKVIMMNDNSFFNTHKNYKVAGFGLSENDNDDSMLRVLDILLSRSSSSQLTDKFSPIPNFLGIEDKNYFLEFSESLNKTTNHGDSGGPVYYETKGENGEPLIFLAGIVTAQQPFQNAVADYSLRVDAFYNDAIATSNRLVNHEL